MHVDKTRRDQGEEANHETSIYSPSFTSCFLLYSFLSFLADPLRSCSRLRHGAKGSVCARRRNSGFVTTPDYEDASRVIIRTSLVYSSEPFLIDSRGLFQLLNDRSVHSSTPMSAVGSHKQKSSLDTGFTRTSKMPMMKGGQTKVDYCQIIAYFIQLENSI